MSVVDDLWLLWRLRFVLNDVWLFRRLVRVLEDLPVLPFIVPQVRPPLEEAALFEVASAKVTLISTIRVNPGIVAAVSLIATTENKKRMRRVWKCYTLEYFSYVAQENSRPFLSLVCCSA